MSRLGLLIFVMGFGCVSMILVTPPFPKSCLAIKKANPRAPSGLYQILVDNSLITVYCEMSIQGGGFTFIPRDAVLRGKFHSLVRQLFTDRSSVLLRFLKKDGRQPYTLIRQLHAYKRIPLGIRMHNYNGYTKPLNAYMGDYLYLGVLPAANARNRRIQGFLSNGQRVAFKNCDSNPNSYFVFFPNHREQAISRYHISNLVYERNPRTVAVKWRLTGRPSLAHRQVPNDFFFLTEIHFGGCGTYTSSDRWSLDPYHAAALGTAIGLR